MDSIDNTNKDYGHQDFDPLLGPIAVERPHEVYFGKVEGENRGKNPMDPPIVENDPWFWLRDDKRENEEVIAHLRKEERHFKNSTSDLTELTAKIYDEHILHIQETDTSDPYFYGDYVYYSRVEKGKSYKIYCRVRKEDQKGVDLDVKKLVADKEEIILDVNKLGEGKSHCDVSCIENSPDHSQFLYSVDYTGKEVYEIRAINDKLIPDVITGTNGCIEWCYDKKFFFYVTKDETLRDNRIWMHRFGTKQEEDYLIYEEPDEIYSVYMHCPLEGNYLVVGSRSSETSEEHLIQLSSLTGDPKNFQKILVRAREKGVIYRTFVHENGNLVIKTNANDSINNKIVLSYVSNPSDWSRVIVPHNDSLMLSRVIVFKDFMVIEGRQNGFTCIFTISAVKESKKDGENVFFPINAEMKLVPVKDAVYTHELVFLQNCEYLAKTFRAKYSSLCTPESWIDYCPFTHSSKLVKQREVGGDFKTENYICERRYATAPDHTKISISLVYRKDMVDLSSMSNSEEDVNSKGEKRSPVPTLLYGYGSYGICIEPSFSSTILPYLDRGMLYAIAHIRGGGENGRAWFEVYGKYLTKRNTFQDFISCAEYLINDGITSPSVLAIEGRSAGGLLIGAVLNMRPDLFKAAVAGVPFVDVMTTMCDPSIPLTTGEWEEWGNPNEYKYFDYMRSYSPIDNVRRQNYPNLLIVSGFHDPRVAYWEPTKWATKLRKLKQNTNKTEVLLKMDLESGHFSAFDRYKYLKEKAIEQAWVIKHLIRKALGK